MRVISQQVSKFLPQTIDVLTLSVTSESSPELPLRFLWAGFVMTLLKDYESKQKSHLAKLAELFCFWWVSNPLENGLVLKNFGQPDYL